MSFFFFFFFFSSYAFCSWEKKRLKRKHPNPSSSFHAIFSRWAMCLYFQGAFDIWFHSSVHALTCARRCRRFWQLFRNWAAIACLFKGPFRLRAITVTEFGCLQPAKVNIITRTEHSAMQEGDFDFVWILKADSVVHGTVGRHACSEVHNQNSCHTCGGGGFLPRLRGVLGEASTIHSPPAPFFFFFFHSILKWRSPRAHQFHF